MPQYLVGQIPIKPPPDDDAARRRDGRVTTRPGPGEPVTFTEQLTEKELQASAGLKPVPPAPPTPLPATSAAGARTARAPARFPRHRPFPPTRRLPAPRLAPPRRPPAPPAAPPEGAPAAAAPTATPGAQPPAVPAAAAAAARPGGAHRAGARLRGPRRHEERAPGAAVSARDDSARAGATARRNSVGDVHRAGGVRHLARSGSGRLRRVRRWRSTSTLRRPARTRSPRSPARPSAPSPLNAAPLAATPFDHAGAAPGIEQCFVVRTVAARRRRRARERSVAAGLRHASTDIFPPAAPKGLAVVAWTAA